MSVTFCPIGAQYTRVLKPCDMFECTPEDRCGYCNSEGMMEDSERDAPDLNVANATASVLLTLLGLHTGEDYYQGEVPAEMVGNVRQRVMVALNSAKRREVAVVEASIERNTRVTRDEHGQAHIGQGPTIYHGGHTDEAVIDRLTRLDAVLASCQERGVGMHWT